MTALPQFLHRLLPTPYAHHRGSSTRGARVSVRGLEEVMQTFQQCPNCDEDGSTRGGPTPVWQCHSHHTFCSVCERTEGGFLGIGGHPVCPDCGGKPEHQIGTIHPDED